MPFTCVARAAAGFMVLLIGSAGYDERLIVASLPLNPLIMSVATVWAISLSIEFQKIRYVWLWQLPLLPLGATLLWSPDLGYGAYKYFNLVLTANLGVLFWISVIRDYGEAALARSLLLLLASMFVVVFWYKLQFGFFDRSVKFFLQGPITFARLMGLAMIISAFYLRGLTRFLAIPLFFAAVVWTGSKGPMLAAGLGFLTLTLFSDDRRFRRYAIIGLGVLIAATIWALSEFEVGFLRLDRLSILWSFDFDSLSREGDYDSFSGRYWVAVRTFDLIFAHPFGAGLGGWERIVANNLGLTYPHNLLLELWSEAGLLFGSIALLSFVAFVGSPRSVWKYCALFLFLSQMFSGDLLDARYLLVFSVLSYFAANSPVWKR